MVIFPYLWVLCAAPREKPISQLARLSLSQAEWIVVFVSFHREHKIASEIVIVRPLGDSDLEGVPDASIEPNGVGRHVNSLVVGLSVMLIFQSEESLVPDRSIRHSAYKAQAYRTKECLPRICAIGSTPTRSARRRRIVSNGTDTRHTRAAADASDLVRSMS